MKRTRARLPDRLAKTNTRLAVRAVVVPVVGVRLAAARLRQAAANEIGAGDDGDVEPCLAGDELVGPAAVAARDGGGADENRDNDADHCPELGGLKGCLGLGRQTASRPAESSAAPRFRAAGRYIVGRYVPGCHRGVLPVEKLRTGIPRTRPT